MRCLSGPKPALASGLRISAALSVYTCGGSAPCNRSCRSCLMRSVSLREASNLQAQREAFAASVRRHP